MVMSCCIVIAPHEPSEHYDLNLIALDGLTWLTAGSVKTVLAKSPTSSLSKFTVTGKLSNRCR